MNLYPVAVIENFYKEPDKIRKFALSQKFETLVERKNAQFVYPGARTKDLVDLDKNLHNEIVNKFVSLFHNSEYDIMRWAFSTNFQRVSAEFGEGVIHTDHDTILAAVLYLSPNAPLDSGTSLFKPNATFDEQKYKKALAENDDRFRAGEIKMDTSYHSMFDEIVRINNVYNTLIVYEGRHYHAANRFFGDTPENSRLSQVFFINRIDAQKHSVFPIHRTNQFSV